MLKKAVNVSCLVTAHLITNYMNHLNSKWRNSIQNGKILLVCLTTGYYCQSLNISIIKQLSNTKCLADYILHSHSLLKLKCHAGIHVCLLWTVKPAFKHFNIENVYIHADMMKNSQKSAYWIKLLSRVTCKSIIHKCK